MAKYQYQQVTGPLSQYDPAQLAWQPQSSQRPLQKLPAKLASFAGVFLLIAAPDPAAALDWLPKAEQPARTLQSRSGVRAVAPFEFKSLDWLQSGTQPARILQAARVTSSVTSIFPDVLLDWYPLVVQPQRTVQSRASSTVGPIFQTSPLDWIPSAQPKALVKTPGIGVRAVAPVILPPAPDSPLDWIPSSQPRAISKLSGIGVRTVAPIVQPSAPTVFLDWLPLSRQPSPKLRPRAGSYVISPILHPIADEQAVDPGPAVGGQQRHYQYQQIAAPLPFDAPEPGEAAEPPAVAAYSIRGYQYQSLAAPFFIAPAGFDPATLSWVPHRSRQPYGLTRSRLGEFLEPPPGGVYNPSGLQWKPIDGHRARGLLLRLVTHSVSDPVNPDQPTFDEASLTWLPSAPAYPRALTAGRNGEYLDPLIQVRTPDLEWLPAGEYPPRRLITLLAGDSAAPVFVPPDPVLLDWSPELRGDIQRQLPFARGTRTVQPSLAAIPFDPAILQWLPESEYYWSISVWQYQAYSAPVLVPPFTVFNPSSLQWLPSARQPPRSKPYARVISSKINERPIFFDPALSLSFLPAFQYPGRALKQARIIYSILDLVSRVDAPPPPPDEDDVTPGCIEPKCPGPKKKPPKKREPKKLRALKAENKALREQSEALKIIVNAITDAVGDIETAEDYDRVMAIVETARNQIADFVHKREMLNVIIMTLLMLEDD